MEPESKQQEQEIPRIDGKVIEELKKAQEKVIEFQNKCFVKFKDYILGVSILPPRKEDEGKTPVLILIDDSDSKKIPKSELKEKLTKVFDEIAKELNTNILPEILLLTEMWQYCYDGKYEILQDIAMSVPTYDVGMLQAIKLIEIHKRMVLEKFEKYIVSYVLGGSLVQGTATTKSDVDVFIIIDDTDVKRMTRAELRDKLRAIIIDMGFQAGELTGVKNKINIQVYILTDFWDYIKEANPVIFTFLRDGVPFHDKGTFMPWKQLLKMGKIRPSQESIDQLMSYGDQYLKRVKLKLREMGVEDFFWATVTPSQAAIMMQGYPPPTPKELSKAMKEIFVDKHKLLEPEYVDIWDKIFGIRKDIEHGTKTEIRGAEIDELYEMTKKYVDRINKLFETIQEKKDLESVLHTYENTVTLIRDALQAEGLTIKESDLLKTFEKELVKSGRVPEKFVRILKDIAKAKKDYDANKITRTGVHDINKKGREFFRFMLDYLQRKRGRELERAKIKVKYGDKFAEVIMLDDHAYIIHDVQAPEKQISKSKLREDGGLEELKPTDLESFEEEIAKAKFPDKVFLKEAIFEDIKNIFGKDVEILVTQ